MEYKLNKNANYYKAQKNNYHYSKSYGTSFWNPMAWIWNLLWKAFSVPFILFFHR